MRFERRLGQRGVGLLRIAVMEVLFQAWENGECIGGAEIGRRADIFREPGYARKQGNDDIVWGILNSLAKTKHVTKCIQGNNRPGWTLTEKAAKEREAIATIDHEWGGPKKLAQLLRPEQWGLCVGCLAPLPKEAHMDHIKPKAKGGSDEPENMMLLCPNCNMSKGKKPFGAWLAERFGDVGPWPDFDPNA